MSQEITVELIAPDKIGVWSVMALPLLDKALSHNKMQDKYPLTWCQQKILDGKAQLWLIWKGRKITGAAMTLINNYPSGTQYLEIFLVGGWGMKLWGEKALESIMTFARGAGCSTLAAGGRLGWNYFARKYPNARVDSLIAIDLEA